MNTQSVNKEENWRTESEKIQNEFSDDELTETTKGMDKTDYTPLIGGPRWFNLEKIMDDVIKVKQKYQEWSLK
jgi:hypothetical protein